MAQITQLRSSNVADVVRRSARRSPAAVAIDFAERRWSYAELDDAVTTLARYLLDLDVRPGDRVAAYGANSDIYAIAFLACARAGIIHVPVNFQLRGGELEYILADSGSTTIIADEALAGQVRATPTGESAAVLTFEQLVPIIRQPTGEPAGIAEFKAVDTDIAQLLYTSGTTSAPKGAIMTHRAFIHEYVGAVFAFNLIAGDRVLNALPLYHSAQMHAFFLPSLMVGAYNVILPVPEPAAVLERIESDQITSFFAAPTVWVALANHPDLATRDLSSLTTAIYGASIMPAPILARLQERLPELGFYNGFGQSELGPLCTVLLPEEHADHPGSAGRPTLFVETRVVDTLGNDVAPGEQGEILYRSPQLCEGYWNKPDETADAFRSGWFHSGDLVIEDDSGFIEVVDRVKDVINTGGVVVASREVEDALFTLDGVAEVAVVGVPDEKWIEAITAYIVPTQDSDLSPEAVIAHARGRLAGFKTPKTVHFVDQLPKNTAGKILKRDLRDRSAG